MLARLIRHHCIPVHIHVRASTSSLIPPGSEPTPNLHKPTAANLDTILSAYQPTSYESNAPEGPVPRLLINCLANNIFLTLSNNSGHLLFKLSSGLVGFSGAAKTSPKAALALFDTLQKKLTERRIDAIRVDFRGINSSRPLLIDQLKKTGIRITEVMDSTRTPFNGCRPKKARRL